MKDKETLEEVKCVNGCKHYYGGEIRHHKDCFYYPESFSKMYDDLEWQQERSYSEEDMQLMFEFGYRNNNFIESTFKDALNYIKQKKK